MTYLKSVLSLSRHSDKITKGIWKKKHYFTWNIIFEKTLQQQNINGYTGCLQCTTNIYRLYHYIWICNDTMTQGNIKTWQKTTSWCVQSCHLKAQHTVPVIHPCGVPLFSPPFFFFSSVRFQSESPSSTPTAPTAPASSSSLPRRRSPGHTNNHRQSDLFLHCIPQITIYIYMCKDIGHTLAY